MRSGDVVVLTFPFSDLSGSKLRPGLVLADAGRDDYVACQITSNPESDPLAIELTEASYSAGGLRTTSYACPGKLFTAHRSVITKRVARVTDAVKQRVREAVIAVIRHD